MSEPRYEITGGADEAVTAAVAAVIVHLIDAAADAVARPALRPTPSPWVQAGRPRPVPPPLPALAYHPLHWSETTDEDEA